MLLSEMNVADIRHSYPLKVQSLQDGKLGEVLSFASGVLEIQWEGLGRRFSINRAAATNILVCEPSWMLAEPRNRTQLMWNPNGHFVRPHHRGTQCVDVAPLLKIFEPAEVMKALLLMQANMNEEKLWFKDRAQFEAAQLKLEELIRLYENLV